jgi:hypothetical protein
MNGAHYGIAGFASASDPNISPVLYDPTLPVGQRMRELSSSTIARLYHSESTLLPDGSVLVSGSDPRDPNYPEEYRHEKFFPPYLLTGAQRPGFAVGNPQWAYGGTYAIKFKAAGPSTNIRVTLIGGENLFPSSIPYALSIVFFFSHFEYAQQHDGKPNDYPTIHMCRIRLRHHRSTECGGMSTGMVPAVHP